MIASFLPLAHHFTGLLAYHGRNPPFHASYSTYRLVKVYRGNGGGLLLCDQSLQLPDDSRGLKLTRVAELDTKSGFHIYLSMLLIRVDGLGLVTWDIRTAWDSVASDTLSVS